MDTRPVTPDTLLRQLEWRYATKKFDPTKKISAPDWETLKESLRLAASSYGLQPFKFFEVSDSAVRTQLPAFSWGQTQPVDASHFVVFAYRKDLPAEHIERYLTRIAEVRGVTQESLDGFRKLLLGFRETGAANGQLNQWASRQAYIALGTLLTSAALLGIDACPMEGFQTEKYDEILGIARQGYASVCACALGFRAADDSYATLPKVRLAQEDLIERI